MTVTVTSTIEGPLTPNGVTTVFGFPFKVLSGAELEVYRGDPDNWTLIDDALYSVTLSGGEGGQVVFTTPPAAGTGPLYIVSAPSFQQQGGFAGGEVPFTPTAVSELLDQAAVRALILRRDVGRAIKAPIGDEPGFLPSDRAGRVLGFDQNKKPVAVPNDSAAVADDLARAEAAAETSVANAAQTGVDRVAVEAARSEAELSSAIAQGAALTKQFYPGARSYVPQGLRSVAITAGGSGGANGTYTVPLAGDNLTVDASVNVTVAGGAITAASVNAPGLYVGSSLSIGSVDLSGITGLTGATVTPTGGYLVNSGEYYYTDHATDPEQAARFQNQANAAVEVDPSVDYLKIALARSYAEAAESVFDTFEDALMRGFEAIAERAEPVDNTAWPDTSFPSARKLAPGAFDCGGADSDMAAGEIIAGWEVRAQLLAGASKLTVALMRCALDAEFINDRPTVDVGWEEVIAPFDVSVASLGLTAGLPAGQWENAQIPFPETVTSEDGYSYVPVIEVFDGSNVEMNFGRGTVLIESGEFAGKERKQGWAWLFGTNWNGLGGAPDHAFYSRVLRKRIVNPADLEQRLEAVEAILGEGDVGITPNFVWPVKLALTEGREMPIWPGNMASARILHDQYLFTASSELRPLSGVARTPLYEEGSGKLPLIPERIGSKVQLIARARGSTNQRYVQMVEVEKVAYASSAAPRYLLIGDSLGQQGITQAIFENLEDRGMSPTTIGTIFTDDITGATDTTHRAEARGGKALADYTYQREYDAGNGSTMQQIAPGGEAAYLAMNIVDQMGYNPFLETSSGDDSFNGKRFSLAYYLTRFGFSTPTHVIIGLGTNDLLQGLMSGYSAGLTAMLNRIRAVSSDIQIALYHDAWGLGNYEAQKAGHHAMVAAAAGLCASRADPKLRYIPTGLFMSEQGSAKLTVGAANSTGLSAATINVAEAGEFHTAYVKGTNEEFGTNLINKAEVLSSWIAATA